MMDEMMPRIAQADTPSTDPPHELMAVIEDLQARLTKLEARDTRGLLGKLFGKGTMVALLLAVFLISGTAWAGVFGHGSVACGSWTAEKEAEGYTRVIFLAWVAGRCR